jgi:hypothetical protein
MSDPGSFRSVERPAGDLPKETTAELKAEIDAGRTGDKVDARDLAAVPLGTDDEAAGTLDTQARIALARATELPPGPRHPKEKPVYGLWVWAIGAVVLAAAAYLLLDS